MKNKITKAEYKHYLRVSNSFEEKLLKILEAYVLECNDPELLDEIEYNGGDVRDCFSVNTLRLDEVVFSGIFEVCMPTKYIFNYPAWKKEMDKEREAEEKILEQQQNEAREKTNKCLDKYKGKEREALKILLENDNGNLRQSLLLAKKNEEKKS